MVTAIQALNVCNALVIYTLVNSSTHHITKVLKFACMSSGLHYAMDGMGVVCGQELPMLTQSKIDMPNLRMHVEA